jgi:hypothetical protein
MPMTLGNMRANRVRILAGRQFIGAEHSAIFILADCRCASAIVCGRSEVQ